MTDTVKILRPKQRRRAGGPGGRVEHDSLGNAVWTRSRASDSEELPDVSALSILEEIPSASSAGPSMESKEATEPAPKRVGKYESRS